MTSRRSFIGNVAALGVAGCPVLRLAAAYAPGRRPNMSFGVVSDIHVRIAPDGNGMRKSHDCSAFVQALKWFRDQNVDAVMVAGDLADTGLVKELEAVAAAWQEVFPGDKAPDGRRVERIFITGNHDWDAYTYDGGVFVKKLYPDDAERRRNLICSDLKGVWERVMQEPYVPIYRKDVKGYSFVGAHWQNEPCHPKCETAFRHVPKWFAENGAALDPSKPFFYCQHAHLQNTVYGPWAWGHDSGETTAALMKFPNAVAFSGHSHYILTDERSIWQGGFTSLGTASLRACTTPNDEFPDTGYENAWGGENAFKVMPPLPESNRQGMLVRVFDDCIAFSRRDFSVGRMLGGDWVVPLAKAGARRSEPFSFAARRSGQKPPEFAAGAALSVTRTAATNRGGKAKVKGVKTTVPKEPADAISLTFPQAGAVRDARPFFYEATFAPESGDAAVRRVLASRICMPEGDYWSSEPETMTVRLDRLPPLPLMVEVRAVSALGAKSRPLAGRAALASPMPDVAEIKLPGEYRYHLQDVCRSGDFLYWAHTSQLVKTDLSGKVLARADVSEHHAGIEVRDGRVYVAVCVLQGKTGGKTLASSRVTVNVYDADTLKMLDEHVTDINDRSGSLAILEDGTFLVGCLRPPDISKTQVRFHHLDRDFKLIKSYVLDNVPVKLGIETIRLHGGHYYLNQYLKDGLCIKLDRNFREVARYNVNGTYGLIFDGEYIWVGDTRRVGGSKMWSSSLRRIRAPKGF